MKDVARNLGISEFELSRTCGEFAIRELSLVGSGVRTDADGDRVLDLLVDFGASPCPGVPLLARMREKFEALTGCSVNLMPRATLTLGERQRVLSRAVPIYPVDRSRPGPAVEPVELKPAPRFPRPASPPERSVPASPPVGAPRGKQEPWVHPLHRGKNGRNH